MYNKERRTLSILSAAGDQEVGWTNIWASPTTIGIYVYRVRGSNICILSLSAASTTDTHHLQRRFGSVPQPELLRDACPHPPIAMATVGLSTVFETSKTVSISNAVFAINENFWRFLLPAASCRTYQHQRQYYGAIHHRFLL